MKTKRVIDGSSIRKLKNLTGLDKKVGKVGWFASSTYPNGTPVAYVASIQEFGVPEKNIPSRSFFRSTIAEKEKDWKSKARTLAKFLIKNEINADIFLETLTLVVAGDTRKKITQITSPALKQSTINARLRQRADKTTVGSLTKPLVDTRHMLNTLTNLVEDK